MMEFEEGELGDLEFGEKSAEIGDGGSSDNGEPINTILLNDEGDTTNVAGSLIGLKRKNCDDIYRLYCELARQVGFSVRKTTTRWNEDKTIITEKKYVCSSEGMKRSTDSGLTKKTYVTRTGCKASLRAKLNAEGSLFEVLDHNTAHNHILTRKSWNHLHRSQRVITKEKAIAIDTMISSGMKATDSFGYMAEEAGGEQCLGHTRVDHLNYVNRLKMRVIEAGDTQTLYDTLNQDAADDPGFFFRIKVDDEGRLCNVFWRDSMMKEDYMIYGDVLVFDTTYRTNKYNLICAPFVGANNHRQNVMFGFAFISNEKTESFEWLFEVFTKSMEGKTPVTVFTDQDLAIASALEKVFPKARHRLCLWHLYQNAVSHFGKLKGDKVFNDLFNKCMSGCSNEGQFEECWSSMISTYCLQDNSWFRPLYGIREKWSTAFNKDFFSIGTVTSQRSESTNHSIGFKAKPTTSLSEFYNGAFKQALNRWRDTEKMRDFQCSKAIPNSTIPLTGFLKHASEVYTLTVFKDFEAELIKSFGTSCMMVHYEDGVTLYNVVHDDGVTAYDVVFSSSVNTLITCSCKMFEECGLLCRHCLRIFHMHSVQKIPDCYIKRRWTKFAKEALWDRREGGLEPSDKVGDCVGWRSEIMRTYYNLVLKAQKNNVAREVLEKGYTRDNAEVDTLMTTADSNEEGNSVCSSRSVVTILDPTTAVTKGRKARHKSFLEKGKKRKTTGSSNPSNVVYQSKEFGTITPNPRLF
ncbi:hypothetical protein CASFOL_033653 [Castilleja foliolosa]|uniref:SWIM-type domain-containing protein n=1 Tax=Castilleja foliolosa TaxID=1961234 RepID=A0ABD3BY61_9LAMI